MLSSGLCFAVIIVFIASGDKLLRIMENHNDPNISYKPIGSWVNWFIGYRVNARHDGYLDIGDITLNASHLGLNYSVSTECINDYAVFANGRIYCTSENMLYSYYAQNGSISFWYVVIGPSPAGNPTFAIYGDYASLFLFSSQATSLHIFSIDPMTGILQNSTSIKIGHNDYYSPFATGTPYGQIYFTIKTGSKQYDYSFVDALNIQTFQFSSSPETISNPKEIPTICDDKVIVSGYYANTVAYSAAPYFQQEWNFDGDGSSHTVRDVPPAVCFKGDKGFRVVSKQDSPNNGMSISNNCYVLDAFNGEEINISQCGSAPIFHYNKDSGYADIVIVEILESDQISVIKLEGDQVWDQQLWSNYGDVEKGFIVDNWFITAYTQIYSELIVVAYNIYNGDIVFVKEFSKSSTDSYSIFGGLYDDDGTNEFMLIVRVAKILYAYTRQQNS